jgi:tRNA A37 methylthiotransferase MiaB
VGIVNTLRGHRRGPWRQATQTIRKLRRENPAAQIIVTGCAAQIEPERFAPCPRSIA